MIIDIHCHYALTARQADPTLDRLSFEPAETEAGPALDSLISPRAMRKLPFIGMKWILGFSPFEPAGPRIDAKLEERLREHLLADGPVDRIVLLAFDAYHDHAGFRRPPAAPFNSLGSDIYTSNSLICALCAQHSDRFLLGASVHPYRENAVNCIDEVFERGATLIKWLPLHQNIDVADPRTIAVMQRCADLGLPLLIHCGPEFTLATQHPEYEPVGPLLDVLRKLRTHNRMPTTIVAHVATPVTPLGDWTSHHLLVDALRGEFADAPLYADISAMTSWGKIGIMRRLARTQDLHHKFLFATDFPVPIGLPRLKRDLGTKYADIRAEPSLVQQSAKIFQTIGFNEIVMHRAATLLPNVHCQTAPHPSS